MRATPLQMQTWSVHGLILFSPTVYNLVEGISVQETEEEIQQYQAQNRSIILQIQARKV